MRDQDDPNQLEGRGCQCQRLVRIKRIDAQLYARLGHSAQEKMVKAERTPRMPVPPAELNREQKWQMMLSKVCVGNVGVNALSGLQRCVDS